LKSYFLEKISSVKKAKDILSYLLPSQSDPWVLLSENGVAIAYFSIEMESNEMECPAIQCDISGKYYFSDNEVLTILNKLQAEVGGFITDDK